MALQSFTITIGALTDAGNNGKNYVNNQPVYIKKTNGTLASIYRDLAGTSQISQDGLSNVTNSKGQFTFFVDAGDYNAEYQSQVTPITVVGPDYFNNRIDEAVNQIILDLSTSRGFRVRGTFAAGFTYELPNDVGLDVSGNAWIYTDVNALPFTVPAATTPSFPTYTQVTFNQASNVSDSQGTNVQDYINKNLTPFETVSDMRAYDFSSIQGGSRVEWSGYYVDNDGGGNEGIVRTGDSTGLTDDGGSIFVIVNDPVNGVWVEANLKGETVNPLKFGALEYPVDSTTQLQNAFNYSKSIEFKKGVYGYSTLAVTDDAIVNLNGATLKQVEYSGDALIIDGSNVLLKNGIIESNPSATNSNNDGVKINSDNCKLDNIVVDGYYYSIDVRADNCTLEKTKSINSLYAGVRLFVGGTFKSFSLLNHTSEDYAVKGLVVNGTGFIDTIVIDNYNSSIDGISTPVDAMNDLLIDSGEPASTINVGVCKLLNSRSRTAGSGNKILNTGKIIIENTELKVDRTYSSGYGLLSTADTVLKDVEANNRIHARNLTVDRLKFKDCVTGLAELIGLIGGGDKADLRDLDYSDTNTTISGQVIRLDRSTSKDEFIKLGNIKGDGVSTLLGVFTAPTNRIGFLELQGSLQDVATISTVSVYRDSLFVRISPNQRRFGARASAPTSGDYTVGDIHPISTLSASSTHSEYVCVQDGNPGTWYYQNPITSI